ncbi:hypothetical protein BVC71_12425 [Marivivens niveibacter]|uniref:Lipid/polyisoprenoid-binding YceI-like domain-containing protein n=1 Tax=Marivivens niveibacter TaxID=1930667 RepID=A0A251WX78_9RHOB|nr:YceI family protein [Marivivens niveibacter]OUD08728.1 hypothetical protein BVC71_12425 [Marivivens niveibacter]
MKKLLLTSAVFAGLTTAAFAETVEYTVDSSHAQVVFDYNHLGFSTTTGMFSGFTGTIDFDAEDPAASSVSIEIPAASLITGWDARDAHFLTDDFFGAEAAPLITFVSTGIEVTGENTGLITGDLTVNGVTKSVVLDTVMTQMADHPMQNVPWVGFDATTTLIRSDFDMGNFAPYVSDEVEVAISIEAMAAQ